MNVLRFSDKDYAARLGVLAQSSSLFDPVVEERTRTIVEAEIVMGAVYSVAVGPGSATVAPAAEGAAST